MRYLITSSLLAVLSVPWSNAQQDVTFAVQPSAAQSTFHVGERIPLELSFSSDAKDHFAINMAGYDRGGRMNYEHFTVSPGDGWSDPLSRYFSVGSVSGGLTFFEVLKSTPTAIPIDLNEWIRFDQPGTYSVIVSSRRLMDRSQKRVFNGTPPAPLQAKAFLLTIIAATPEWQAATLQAASAVLTSAPSTQGLQPAERKAALADLRFLGTPAAIKELVSNLRDDRADLMGQSAFGLMGVAEPMRDVALRELERSLDDPTFPISIWFIETMALLNSQGDRSEAKEQVWRKVLAELPRKEGEARASTVQTLLSHAPVSIDPESKAALARILSTSFLDLPEDQQAGDLRWQWDMLRSASMLPVLQASARLPLTRPGSNDTSSYSRRDLKSAALARWFELDPEGAAQELLSQIGSATPSMNAQSLAFLPKQTFPQFEPLWAQRLLESTDDQEETVLAGLLVRFGTGSASAQIISKLRTGSSACAPQAADLAYLVKFDPDQARLLLQRVIEAGPSSKTGCYLSLFQDVATHASGAALTDVAVASLDNADRRVVINALVYLIDHGRTQDQKPIWNRYVKWSEQWAGKAEVFDLQDEASVLENYQEIAVGENLARALIADQGWLADKSLINRVTKMCVGQQVCQSLRSFANAGVPPYSVAAFRNGSSENYQVGQYSAKSLDLLDEKLKQFQKGTIFLLTPAIPRNNDQRILEIAVRRVFEKNGLCLQALEQEH